MNDDVRKVVGSFADKAQAVRKRELGAVFLDHKDVEQVAGSGRVGDQCKMPFVNGLQFMTMQPMLSESSVLARNFL